MSRFMDIVKIKTRKGKRVTLDVQWISEKYNQIWCLRRDRKNENYYAIDTNTGRVDMYDEFGMNCLRRSVGRMKDV